MDSPVGNGRRSVDLYINYLIYKVNIDNEALGAVSYYTYAGFTDIIKTEDICTTDLTRILRPSGSYGNGASFELGEDEDGQTWYASAAYKTEDDLKYDVIDKNVSEYIYEILK